MLNTNSLLSCCWNPVIIFCSIPLNLFRKDTIIVVGGKKPLGKCVQQGSWNIQYAAFVKIQMSHLKEWSEAQKPPQIIVVLPGNLSKGKTLSADSVFQGITIKNWIYSKIKNPSWFPFYFPATPTSLFSMYILVLSIFFSLLQGIWSVRSWFSSNKANIWMIFGSFCRVISSSFHVCCCGRCNKRKKWRIHCWDVLKSPWAGHEILICSLG